MRHTRQAEQPEPSLTGAAPAREHRTGLHALGIDAARLAGPIVARSGGGILARAKAEWSAIVGAETAAATWPAALRPGGVLTLRVAPGAALELQHRAPLVIERINVYFGRPLVTRLALVQGGLPLAEPKRPLPAAPSAETEAEIERRLAGFPASDLRRALAALGRAVVGRSR